LRPYSLFHETPTQKKLILYYQELVEAIRPKQKALKLAGLIAKTTVSSGSRDDRAVMEA